MPTVRSSSRSGDNEAGVLRAVLQYLTLAGIVHWRNNTGTARYGKRFVRFGEPGAADIVGVLEPHGRLFACECKHPTGGRLSAEQRAWLDRVERAGGVVVVARGVEDVRRRLREEGYEVP